MTINLNTSQVILLIALVFLLMAGSLSALVFILEVKDNRESTLDIASIISLIYKLRKIAILLAILFLLVSYIVYRFI